MNFILSDLEKCPDYLAFARMALVACARKLLYDCDMLFCMDSIRTFKSFQKQVTKRQASPRKNREIQEDGGRPAMQMRDLSEKPALNRSEILEKLENNKKGKFRPNQVQGQKFGEGFMKDEPTQSDVGINNPSDPMTSEKLKSVLVSGAVNFSGKEKEILGKILNG